MSDAPDLAGSLGKQYGPLPLAGWLAAVGGGLLIAVYLRRHNAASSAPASDPTAGDTVAPTTSGSTDGTGGAAVSYPGNVSAPIDSADSSGTQAEPISNNGMWRQQAVKWLVGDGHGAIESEIAVGNYLAGGTLSQAQANLVNRAIAAIGPTPDAPPAISVAAPTPPPAVPTPNPAPTSNTAWRRVALDWMIHHGHQPTGSAGALDNYLSGHPMGPKAQAAVNDAIRHIGAPPQPVPHRRDTGTHHHPKR